MLKTAQFKKKYYVNRMKIDDLRDFYEINKIKNKNAEQFGVEAGVARVIGECVTAVPKPQIVKCEKKLVINNMIVVTTQKRKRGQKSYRINCQIFPHLGIRV